MTRLAIERNALGANTKLPKLSTYLDSVRAYQYELQFFFPKDIPGTRNGGLRELNVAVKQVNAAGLKVEDIEVNRLNDKYYYPGKPSMDELVVTFDNLYKTKAGAALFQWFRACTYDPVTGYQTPITGGYTLNSSFKAEKVRLIQYDGTLTPFAYVDFIGVYPKSMQLAEHNYATNDFHTITMNLRYDFIDMFNSSITNQSSLLDGIFG